MHARQTCRLAAIAMTAGMIVMAGCNSGSSGSSSGTTTSASTATTAGPGSSTSASTSTTTGGSTSTTTPASTRCHTSQLTAAVGANQGAAGSIYIAITLTNHGSTTCVIAGYPGVSLLDGGGHQIGTPATRATGSSHPVTLVPGAVSSTTVHTLNAGVAPGGCWAPSASVKIYPPDELDSLTARGSITVCGNTFSVTPMARGAG
jgi:Protein of unknown function (DUF4232)